MIHHAGDKPRTLLIGWDAADWKVIRPLIDRGLMPHLQRLMDRGVSGNLATLEPILSPMLWNSIATGKRPDKHGIHGFIEPAANGKGVRPVTSTSRKCKAIWNILTQEGYRTNVVGWFASHPAEPINGACVSDQYHRVGVRFDQPWPLLPNCIYPPRLVEPLKWLRVHPQEFDAQSLLTFMPRAAEIDQDKDRRLAMLAKLLSEMVTVHTAATYLMEHEPWDFTAVYYSSIDHFSHAFMRYHPPKMDNVPDRDFELYSGVVNGAYCMQDMMLGRLLELAGPDTLVMVVSDHGFHSDHLRPRGVPKVPAGPAVWHRPQGICVIHGPGIAQGQPLYGATLLDITPTILTALGLPVGADMVGRALLTAFDPPRQIDRVISWDQIDGEAGMHPDDMREDPVEAREAIRQLVELGYIEAPDENQEKAAEHAVREQRYNLARSYRDAGQHTKATELFEQLIEQYPDDRRYKTGLANCYLSLGRLPDARDLLTPMLTDDKPTPRMRLAMGRLELASRRHDAALEHLRLAEEAEPRLPGLHLMIGQVYLRMRRWADAERAYRKAVDIDADSAAAHMGIARACLRRKQFEQAVEHALVAAGLSHHDPMAHFYLGVALARLGQHRHAVQAFEQCLAVHPGMVRAHRWLAAIYRNRLRDPERAEHHLAQLKQVRDQRFIRRASRHVAKTRT